MSELVGTKRETPACPFTLTMTATEVPGLVGPPQMGAIASPCLLEKCAIYDRQEQACSLLAIGARIDLLNFSLDRMANSSQETATAVSATVGIREPSE